MIIGVCGFAGSGKDTFADRLHATHGFKKTNFARALKQVAKDVFGFSNDQLYGPSSLREEQDKRYPFSGVCPRCHSVCNDYRGDPSQNECREGFVYWCHSCNEQYPEFVTPRLAL